MPLPDFKSNTDLDFFWSQQTSLGDNQFLSDEYYLILSDLFNDWCVSEFFEKHCNWTQDLKESYQVLLNLLQYYLTHFLPTGYLLQLVSPFHFEIFIKKFISRFTLFVFFSKFAKSLSDSVTESFLKRFMSELQCEYWMNSNAEYWRYLQWDLIADAKIRKIKTLKYTYQMLHSTLATWFQCQPSRLFIMSLRRYGTFGEYSK